MEDYKQKCEQLTKFIKDLYPFMSDYCKEKTEGMIPELKESEDERIRKSIIEEFKVKAIGGYEEKFFRNGVRIKDAIAWLEKQGKQIPIKWTEEDVLNINQAIYVCHQYEYFGVETWLKSLRERIIDVI